MAFTNEKLIPNPVLKEISLPVLFERVRSSSKTKSSRMRQCYCCLEKINKGDKYINHQYKYDKRIITVSFHVKCWDNGSKYEK